MVQISVTVDDTHLARVGLVADALRDQGMRVDQVLDTVGVITGEVDPSQADSLRAVDGVASVDPQQQVQLPPPDSPVQ